MSMQHIFSRGTRQRHAIGHIVNPAVVARDSDLFIAQPITFESMRVARNYARKWVKTTLYATQFRDEDRIPLPGCFKRTLDLERSVCNLKRFNVERKLPLIKDVLGSLYNASDADYLIYTNADIALQPYFYVTVCRLVEQGYDAFVINRRSIPTDYTGVDEIPLMYAEIGNRHTGFDCFVFHRKYYEGMLLGDICIGTTKIGVTLIANLICMADKFKLFEDLHLTFHLGELREWQDERFADYVEHNEKQAWAILNELRNAYTQRFDNSPLCMKHFNMLKEKNLPSA